MFIEWCGLLYIDWPYLYMFAENSIREGSIFVHRGGLIGLFV